MKKEELIELGFKEFPHLTVMNSLIYDLGRNRHLSIGCVGTPNEMIFICQQEKDSPNETSDLICLKNFDYDGYSTIEDVKNIIKSIKKMTTVITKNDIISAVAYCGIRQSPYLFPKNLEVALKALEKSIDSKKIFESPEKRNSKGYAVLENSEIQKIVEDLIFNTPEIQIWNVTQVEQDNGITRHDDPKRTIKFAATSMAGPLQSQDRDFIDLDALRQNVCGMIL